MKATPFDILLVEDNQDHAELVKRSFEDHPMANRVHHLSDGEAALDYLFRRGNFTDAKSSPRPHIVLLDLRLPKIDGLDVLKELRSTRDLDEIPVIILTTSNADSDVGKAYHHHANSYLVKPNDFQTFDDLMKALGFYWLSWNHFPGPPSQGLATDSSQGSRPRIRQPTLSRQLVENEDPQTRL